jgi:hypothetical protein
MYCSASHQLDLRSARIDTELGCLHKGRCRSGRLRYHVALSVEENPYVMLARVTEVPPIIAISVHIETSVIQNLQAREEWGVVSEQDKRYLTTTPSTSLKTVAFFKALLSHWLWVHVALCCGLRDLNVRCHIHANFQATSAWQKDTASQVPGRCLLPVCHRVMAMPSPKTRSTRTCL